MGLKSSDLDRRIQFRRAEYVDDGFSQVAHWHDHGDPVWGGRRDVKDAEKFTAGTVQAVIETRFIVRSTSFTRDITPADRLICEGRDYDIIGIKQVGKRHCWLELSARARADR